MNAIESLAMRDDFIVVGAGVVGLAVARRLATSGTVTLLDRGRAGREASWAAAGMLSPRSEAGTVDALLAFGLASLDAYPAFTDELREETGIDPEYRSDGVLVLARSDEEGEELEKRLGWQRVAGLGVEWLSPAQVHRLEPSVTRDVTGALLYPDDHQVRPRSLLRALVRSCRLRGVRLVEGAPVDSVRTHNGAVGGVGVGPGVVDGRTVIVTAGAWTSGIGPRPAFETRPRKGQILALDMGGPVIRRVVRWRNFYLVPRKDHELVVGATNEDVGFDRRVTVGGLSGLLEGASAMAPGISSLAVRETWTGFRPWVPDGLPRIGPSGIDGLFYATGHYRNGILQTPATVGIMDAYVRGGRVPEYARELVPEPASDGASGSGAMIERDV